MHTDTIDLTAKAERGGRAGLLERIALTLGSTLELREVLHLLAEMGREATGAQRCSLFLLDGRTLRPAVAIGAYADDELWVEFQRLEPIRLDGERWELMKAGRAIAFDDARATRGIVPEEWVERFSIGALAMVPLVTRSEPCGVMALDWSEPGPVSPDDLGLLEAVATYAGIAVANARLYESVQRKADLQQALVRGAAALSSVLETDDLAHRLCEGFTDLVDARLCGIGLLNAEWSRVTTLVVKGGNDLRAPLPLDDIPRDLVNEVRAEWEHTPRPLRFDAEPFFDRAVGGIRAGAAWYLLVPLVVEGRARGAALLGFEAERSFDTHEHAAVEALMGLAASALERRLLLDRLARRYAQLDTLFRVSAALTEGADAGALVDEMNALLSGHGIEVSGFAWRDRRLARHLAGAEPDPVEREAWRGGRWRRDTWAELPRGDLAVPMRLGKSLVGTLRVRPCTLDADDRVFVEAVARGLAEVADRSCLRAAVEEAAREQAVADERERMASDLHDTAGSALVSIGLLARQHADALSAGSETRDVMLRLASLADGGRWEIDQAVRALAFMPATRNGLLASVRALARSVGGDSGMDIEVSVSGRPARLSAPVERALYRVAHEALTNAWRHSGARNVWIDVCFAPDGAVLRVRDDGAGFDGTPLEERMGIAGMRRVMRETGGTLRVTDADPHGVVVEAATRGVVP